MTGIEWQQADQRACLRARTDVTAHEVCEIFVRVQPGAASVREPGQLVGEVSLFEAFPRTLYTRDPYLHLERKPKLDLHLTLQPGGGVGAGARAAGGRGVAV